MGTTKTVGVYPQVTGGEKTAGTETGLRSFSPDDIKDMSLEGVVTHVTRQTLSISSGDFAYDVANGVNAKLTLTQDSDLLDMVDGVGNPADGVTGHLIIIQDGTGGWILTKPTNMVMLQGDFADIAGMAASKRAVLSWTSYGSGNSFGWLVLEA